MACFICVDGLTVAASVQKNVINSAVLHALICRSASGAAAGKDDVVHEKEERKIRKKFEITVGAKRRRLVRDVDDVESLKKTIMRCDDWASHAGYPSGNRASPSRK